MKSASPSSCCGKQHCHKSRQVIPAAKGPVSGFIIYFRSGGDRPGRPANLLPPSGPVFSQSMLKYPEVTVAEVEKLPQNIDPFKSTGSDGIPGLVLTQSTTILAPSLQRIFNISLRTGHVPRLFKVSHVSPLQKGGDRSGATNYCPVSLLPIVSRLLEFFVKTYLSKHLVDHDLLPASQFVYRKITSTFLQS